MVHRPVVHILELRLHLNADVSLRQLALTAEGWNRLRRLQIHCHVEGWG